MSAEIKEILMSKGWDGVVDIINKHLNGIEIPETGKLEEIGQRYLAKSMATKAFVSALNELSAIKNSEIKKDTSYKQIYAR